MKLSIVCLNYSKGAYGSTKQTHTCLEKLFQHAPSFPFEVILVDNGSPNQEEVQALAKAWEGKVTFVPLPTNTGYHGGNEAGFQKATGEYFMTVNPDTEVGSGTLDGLISYMDTHTDIGIIGPRLRYPDGTIQDSYRRFMTVTDQVIKRLSFLHAIPAFKKRMHHYLMWNVNPDEVQEVDWIVGTAMVIRKEAYEKIGGYDLRYFLFMGDTDICRTMWKHGYKIVYYPKAEALHHRERLSGGSFFTAVKKKTFWIHVSDMLKYFLKWGL